MVPRRDRSRGGHTIACLIVVVVLPVEPAFLEEQGEAARVTSATDQHTLCAAFRYVHFGSKGVMEILRIGGGSLGNPDRTGGVDKVRFPTQVTWPERGVRTLGETVIERQHVVLGGLGHEQIL